MPQPAPSASYQICHCPATLIDTRALAGIGRLTLRPVLPQDAPLLGALVNRLSAAARRNRFHGVVKLSPASPAHMACVDYRSHLAVVISTLVDGVESLVADARYVVQADGLAAEFALMVDDAWQRQGMGTWALRSLQRAAAQAGVRQLHGNVMEANTPMLDLAQRCGFARGPAGNDAGVLRSQRMLGRTPNAWIRRCWLAAGCCAGGRSAGLKRHWPSPEAAAPTPALAPNHPHPESTP